jgi:opacity protein-like surface antigen
MRKFLLGAVGLAALAMAAPAFAADLAPAYVKTVEPFYDWSGYFLGINIGGGWSHNCWTNTSFLGVATVPGVAEGCNTTVSWAARTSLSRPFPSPQFLATTASIWASTWLPPASIFISAVRSSRSTDPGY